MGCESIFISCLDSGIGVDSDLFQSRAITHSFDLFVYFIGAIILLLTAIYPRRLIETSNNIEEISERIFCAQKGGIFSFGLSSGRPGVPNGSLMTGKAAVVKSTEHLVAP